MITRPSRLSTGRPGLLLVLLTLAGACSPPADDPPESESARASDPWIVFGSGRSGEGDLYGIDPTDGSVVRIGGSDAPEGSPRWDAARNRIVHQRFGDDDEATLVGLSGAGSTELFPDPSDDGAPHWSPDGDFLVHPAERDGRIDLFIARADGSDSRRLTDDDAVEKYPAWSPDGARVAFARREGEGWQIVIRPVNGDSGDEMLVGDPREYVGHLAWSPDGSALAFDTRFDTDDVDLALVELATGVVRRLTDRPGSDLVPAWSPDGTVVAFGGETEGNWDIWTVETATGRLQRHTTDPAFDGAPVFVPAGFAQAAAGASR